MGERWPVRQPGDSINLSRWTVFIPLMFGSHVRRIHAFVNSAVVLAALIGVFIWLNWNDMPDGLNGFLALRITVKNLIVGAIFFAFCTAAFSAFGLLEPYLGRSAWKELIQVVKACSVIGAFALLLPMISNSGLFTPRTSLYFLPVACAGCLCSGFLARGWSKYVTGSLRADRDLIIVGSGPRAASLYRSVRDKSYGRFRLLGFVDSPNGHTIASEIQRQMLGNLDELEEILMRQSVDEVVIALPAKSCYREIQAAIATCERAGVEAKYLADIFTCSLAKPRFESGIQASVVSLKVVQDDYRLLVKRCIDILGAVAGLIIFGPLMLLIAAAVKLTSPGPAVFSQQRYGYHKRLFRMYKFRTMVSDAERLQSALEAQNEAQGPVFKIRADPRITSIGRILRKTSLDELPQLFCVLRGDMSLVGPRPLPKRDVSRFDDASLMRRFSVKPGITCLWQVNGRSDTDFNSWIQLDLQYIDTWSLGLDLMILAKTVPAVIAGRGAA